MYILLAGSVIHKMNYVLILLVEYQITSTISSGAEFYTSIHITYFKYITEHKIQTLN